MAKAAAKTARKAPATKKPAAKTASAPPTWVHGKVFWSEFNTTDVARAKAFYKKTLGYTFDALPMPDGSDSTYWIAKTGNETVGGFFEMTGDLFKGVPDHWLTYIAVDAVDARVKKAVAAGATLERPVFDIPGVGRMGLLRQPGGAMIAWMTPFDM